MATQTEIRQDVKLAYLAGLYAGVMQPKSKLTKVQLVELRRLAGVAAQAVFQGGAFNPLSVWDALAYFDAMVEVTV